MLVMEDMSIILPAEWVKQSAVQLTWPHEETDWAPILDEVVPCFVSIAKEIMKRENLLIVCPAAAVVKQQLGEYDESRVRFAEMETNDTWARDHGGISVVDSFGLTLYDFLFNGWGMKFAAAKDNLITRTLAADGFFEDKQELADMVREERDDSENTGIQVYIGEEVPVRTMKDCSVVTATYELGDGMRGTIGIIGPKRMDYENVVDSLKKLKVQLDEMVNQKT